MPTTFFIDPDLESVTPQTKAPGFFIDPDLTARRQPATAPQEAPPTPTQPGFFVDPELLGHTPSPSPVSEHILPTLKQALAPALRPFQRGAERAVQTTETAMSSMGRGLKKWAPTPLGGEGRGVEGLIELAKGLLGYASVPAAAIGGAAGAVPQEAGLPSLVDP